MHNHANLLEITAEHPLLEYVPSAMRNLFTEQTKYYYQKGVNDELLISDPDMFGGGAILFTVKYSQNVTKMNLFTREHFGSVALLAWGNPCVAFAVESNRILIPINYLEGNPLDEQTEKCDSNKHTNLPVLSKDDYARYLLRSGEKTSGSHSGE